MFFVIRSTCPNTDLTIYRARRRARLQLTLYPQGPAELCLTRYLQENYQMSLYQACLAILQNAKFSLNLDREIIVTIPDPKLNHIARIITYGTGLISGSNILRKMLTIKEES